MASSRPRALVSPRRSAAGPPLYQLSKTVDAPEWADFHGGQGRQDHRRGRDDADRNWYRPRGSNDRNITVGVASTMARGRSSSRVFNEGHIARNRPGYRTTRAPEGKSPRQRLSSIAAAPATRGTRREGDGAGGANPRHVRRATRRGLVPGEPGRVVSSEPT
jgi:hypothetical protein